MEPNRENDPHLNKDFQLTDPQAPARKGSSEKGQS